LYLYLSDKIVDFQVGKESQLHKRKEAKLAEMRQAFRLACGGTYKALGKNTSTKKKRRKSKK